MPDPACKLHCLATDVLPFGDERCQPLRATTRLAGCACRPRLHPGLLHQAIDALRPEQREAPIAQGKWSPREIVAHLADCELAFSFRLRQTLAAPAGEPALLQPFDQTAWSQHYSAYDLPSAFELFRANRGWNLKLIGTLSQGDLAREAHHPERGPLTFMTILETIAGHDLNHLMQLQGLSSSGGQAI